MLEEMKTTEIQSLAVYLWLKKVFFLFIFTSCLHTSRDWSDMKWVIYCALIVYLSDFYTLCVMCGDNSSMQLLFLEGGTALF